MTTALRTLTALLAITASAQAQRTPDDALRTLQDGNRRYTTDHSLTQPVGEGVRRTLARGESPFAIVLCCSDSRVPPEHVFNTGLGELVVVRVAGHLADPETIATIENAVDQSGVPLCVVLGHEQCDSVAAAIAQVEAPTHNATGTAVTQALLEAIEPAVRKVKTQDLGGKALCDRCEEEHVHATVASVMRRSALLRRYESVGKFRMVAARYHLGSGEVEWLPNRPLPVDEKTQVQVVPGSVPNGMPPHVAFRLLQAGHRRFLSDTKPTADVTTVRRQSLTQSQQPPIVVLTCADSRVAPEHVFDAGLGDLLVVRVGGNTLNDSALASIEYAAGQLGSSLLVVLGHTKCTALQNAADGPSQKNLSPHQRTLLQRLEPAIAEARNDKGRDLLSAASAHNALRTLAEARSRSALVRTLEHDGRFAMLAGVYDIASGDIEWLKDKDGAPTGSAELPQATAKSGHGQGAHGADHGSSTNDAHGAGSHDAHANAHAAENAHGDAHGAPTAHGAAPTNDHANGHEPTNSHGAPAGHGDAHGNAQGDAHATPDAHGTPPAAPHGDVQAHGEANLPVVTWTAGHDPETATGNGHGAPAAGHGDAPGSSQGSTAGNGHGDAHAPSHDAHASGHGAAANEHGSNHGNTHGAPVDSHATTPAHGDHGGATDDHSGHGAGNHGQQHGDAATGTNDHGHSHDATPASAHGKNGISWHDPIVLVGITGVVSLLAAAVLAMKK